MRSTQPPALVAADAMFDAGRCLPDSGKRLSRAYGLRRGASGDLWSRSSDRGPHQRRRPAIKAASLVDGERGSAGSMCPGRRRSRVSRWLAEARECPPEKIGLFLVYPSAVSASAARRERLPSPQPRPQNPLSIGEVALLPLTELRSAANRGIAEPAPGNPARPSETVAFLPLAVRGTKD
jgi:hypothetical protein